MAESAHNEVLENQNGALKVNRPVVTDSDHFEEELDPDPDRYQNDAEPQH
jgi:hypothetical protein